MKSPEEQEVDKLLMEVHRNMQIEHGIIDEDGNKLKRIAKGSPYSMSSILAKGNYEKRQNRNM